MINKLKLILTNNKKNILISIIIILIFIFSISNFFLNDHMEQKGIKNVYYKTYNKNKGWTSWTKNGLTSGNKKNKIENIKIKMFGEETTIKIYNGKKWKNLENNSPIYGVMLQNSANIFKNYEVCYRTYNDNDKWLNWICNYGEVSGNSKYNVKAIQIKVIPKGVVRNDYLKNYDKNPQKFKIGF